MNNDTNKIKISISNDLDIVAEKSTTEFNEIYIYLADKDGSFHQDIALVRGNVKDESITQLLVWANENDEDYTNIFNIKRYIEEE